MLEAMHRCRFAIATRLAVALGLGVSLALCGCTRRAGGFQSELDRLRFERDRLETELRQVTLERNELQGKLNELALQIEFIGGEPAAAVLQSLPRCAGIRIDRLTSFYDRDDQPGFEGIDVYLLPHDARDRFVQISGTLQVSALLIPPPGQEVEPVTLATRTITAADIRESYRSTLLSTHYAVQLPLDPPLGRIDGTLLIVVQFRDALTGLTHRAERRLAI